MAYICTKCGDIALGSARDIGVDLERAGIVCDCGGEWKTLPNRVRCPFCGCFVSMDGEAYKAERKGETFSAVKLICRSKECIKQNHGEPSILEYTPCDNKVR